MSRTKRYTFSLPTEVVEPVRRHFASEAQGGRPRYGSLSRFVADAIREKAERELSGSRNETSS